MFPIVRATHALLVVAAAGAIVAALPIVVGLWQARRLRVSARAWPRGQRVIDRLAPEAGITRPVAVRIHADLAGPVTHGMWRPAVMFPDDASAWSDGDVERAALHELEHVRRCDWMIDVIARTICAVYWFHPLIWTAWRQLRLESERAADDAVVRSRDAAGYAVLLVTLAGRLVTRQPHLIAMTSRRDLPVRVHSLLDTSRARGRAGRRCISATVSAAAAVVLGVAPMTAVSRSPWGAQEATTAAGARPTFEVAAIRRCENDPIVRGGATRTGPDRITVACQNVLGLIESAYVMYGDGSAADPATFLNTPIEGGPGWIRTERYSIDAKAPMATPEGVMRGPMMQALLEERFGLRIRRERYEVPIYALTIANGGHKLEPFAEGSCIVAEFPPTAPSEPAPPGQRRCKPDPTRPLSPSEQLRAVGPNRTIEFEGITIADFTRYVLSNPLLRLDRRVNDRTGLSGRFNIRLEYAPPPADPGRPALAALQAAAGEPTAPVIETAIREQLGLRLEPARGEGQRFIIEAIEKSSGN
jgi:uncharacterized protein (TIGR03435 family)